MSMRSLEPSVFPALERQATELSLPAHMLILAIELCQKAGFDLRMDVIHHLNMASARPLAQLNMFSVARVASRVEESARSLMRGLASSDPRHVLYVCAMFPLLLVDEGLLNDPKNQATLVALLIMEDVKNDEPDVAGQRPLWQVNQSLWRKEAGQMLIRAKLLGMYTRTMPKMIKSA